LTNCAEKKGLKGEGNINSDINPEYLAAVFCNNFPTAIFAFYFIFLHFLAKQPYLRGKYIFMNKIEKNFQEIKRKIQQQIQKEVKIYVHFPKYNKIFIK